jgi:hypothetical protein
LFSWLALALALPPALKGGIQTMLDRESNAVNLAMVAAFAAVQVALAALLWQAWSGSAIQSLLAAGLTAALTLYFAAYCGKVLESA